MGIPEGTSDDEVKDQRRWKELWIEGNRTRLAGKMKQIVLPVTK